MPAARTGRAGPQQFPTRLGKPLARPGRRESVIGRAPAVDAAKPICHTATGRPPCPKEHRQL